MIESSIRADRVALFFQSKSILVTGGTGSFGHQIVSELVKFRPECITIFSRDEKKQHDMQDVFRGHENLRFTLGDVRDLERVREVMKGIDMVFHAAALKQVPNTEFAPFEAVKTNIVGAEHIRQAAIENDVHVVVAISTDKAVKPVNVMGMTKAIQERIMLNPRNGIYKTKLICVRYGNVLGSRGSVVPLFRRKVLQGLPLPITHVEMTRFLLTLKQAVQLVFKAVLDGESGDLFVRKMPAARIVDLGRMLAYGITERMDYPQEITGIRPGEKIHEVLVSEEEMLCAVELDNYYLIRGQAQKTGDGPQKQGNLREYTSHNTHRLSDEELLSLLDEEGWLSPTGVVHEY